VASKAFSVMHFVTSVTSDVTRIKHLGSFMVVPRYIPAGLPDGLISSPKSQFGYILEGHGMGNVANEILGSFGIFYGHSLWSFGIFFPFWCDCTQKNLATLHTSYVIGICTYVCTYFVRDISIL
jgi:hypothetical protein